MKFFRYQKKEHAEKPLSIRGQLDMSSHSLDSIFMLHACYITMRLVVRLTRSHMSFAFLLFSYMCVLNQ